MNVSVFGLGYVGCVSAACLAHDGHYVIGVDVNPLKVEMINKMKSPVVEQNLGELIKEGVQAGRLKGTCDAREAVLNTAISLVCVGTPCDKKGNIVLDFIERGSQEIGHVLKEKNERHIIVYRSTIVPGTLRSRIVPILEKSSGMKVGRDFGVCVNPEFLREGTGVFDFYNPPRVLIGEDNADDGRAVESLYMKVKARVVHTRIEVAEVIKYVENAFHALKVAFANEIGLLCKELAIDSHEIMGIFCEDTKLNLSAYYLKPGFAFGGSCLPKDLQALTYRARQLGLDLPLLSSIMKSNEAHMRQIINTVEGFQAKNIGIVGLSFKQGTDDLRESPSVILAEVLIGRGCNIAIYDEEVNLASVIGANRQYINERISHISKLLVPTLDDLLRRSDLVIITKHVEGMASVSLGDLRNKTIFDLVNVGEIKRMRGIDYHGVAW